MLRSIEKAHRQHSQPREAETRSDQGWVGLALAPALRAAYPRWPKVAQARASPHFFTSLPSLLLPAAP